MTAQLIFREKTETVLHQIAPETIFLSGCQNPLATAATLIAFLKWHEKTAVPCACRWLVLVDVALVHCSAEPRERIAFQLPRLTICFIPARATCFHQPLDVAFMVPLKVGVRRLPERRSWGLATFACRRGSPRPAVGGSETHSCGGSVGG